ncbi:transporter substrate-binding domain-containing protein [Streptomyces sp. NPDC002896]|uniref:transporter substrate-binding domain-containing protein n=1 Tax=Streptomyces sp. NPDC002896 TaxID=3154438 RepID=UPI0033238015
MGTTSVEDPLRTRYVTSLLTGALCVMLTTSACSTSDGTDTTEPAAATSRDTGIHLPDKVRQAGVLRVAANFNYAPKQYLDKNHKPAGLEVDLAKAVADKLGVDIEFHQIAGGVENTLSPVSTHEYDFSIGVFNYTPEHREMIDVMAWVASPLALKVRTGNPADVDPKDLCGVTFGYPPSTIQAEILDTISEKCKAAGKPGLKKVSDFDSPNEALVAGKVDALFGDASVAKYYAKKYVGKIELVPGKVPEAQPKPTGWAFPDKSTKLERAVAQAIDELAADGTWQKILSSAGLEDEAVLPVTVDGKPLRK